VPSSPRTGHPKDRAAGIPAIIETLRQAREQMGLRRAWRALRKVNQHDGFDCPGCAWPEPGRPHIAEFCENGAKAVAEEATRHHAGPDFFAAHSLEELASWSDHQLGRSGRLTQPLHLAPGATHYAPISWDDAFGVIAAELDALDSPDEAIFYTSGRTSNEAAFAYQLFVRAFGTNNLPDCSNLCHESSGSALTETIGTGKGTVTLEDVHSADLIFVVGQNPGTNHPRMLTALETAKRNGARIIAVNPLPEAGLMRFKNPQRVSGLVGRGTPLADLFLQIRVNGDLALFKALNHLLMAAEREAPGTVLDHEFIATHCDGFEPLAADLEELDWDEVAHASGLARAEIEAAARMATESKRTVVCWAMGLTQHRNAVATIREIVNFLLLRGNVGRAGAGLCPVRGHSNVQGDRTMGIYEKPDGDFLDRLGAAAGFEPPRDHGHDVVDAIRAMRDGRAHVFMAMGGNFAAAAPDTEATARALRNTRLTVHVSTKPNRSHLVTGRQALILPTLGRSERDERDGAERVVSVEDSMSVVHASRGTLAPASEYLLSEVAIVCRLAQRALGECTPVDWAALEADYARVRVLIEQVVPGFEDFEARLAQPGGFTLPHGARDERRFDTATGRARLTVNPLHVVAVPPGRLLLQTVRSHDQYNTTIYALNDRYRGVRGGRRVVMIHPADLEALGHNDGEIVDLVSEWEDGSERRAARFKVAAYPTARGCAATYFPEANALVPLDHTAEVSNTPCSKSVIVRLEPAAG
jgi:formate dehydrogenase major subunit